MATSIGELTPSDLRADLASRAEAPAHGGERRRLPGVTYLMGILFACLLGVGSCGYALIRGEPGLEALGIVFFAALFGAFFAAAALWYRVHVHLSVPLGQLHTWALSMCRGDLSARIVLPSTGAFADLASHINRLSDALDRLANEMDDLVKIQTAGLKEKNRSLELLYEVASAMSTSRNLDELLEQSAHKLMAVVNAEAATVRLRTDEGHMRLTASIGLDDPDSTLSLDGNAFSEIEALLEDRPPPRGVSVHNTVGDVSIITVPLRYQDQNLGVYSLFTPTPEVAELAEVRRLLVSVGKHLGMAIEKSRLDTEGRKLTIIRERTALAHELHDSLAQTLAVLRFQVRMLKETLERSNTAEAAYREVARIQSGLDEAHTELRELVANFRAPVDGRGLVPAMENIIARFRRDSGMATYFQAECPGPVLAEEDETQVLRIVSEALANVRKHSRAQMVRVLLGCTDGVHRLLVEDDGDGLGAQTGEHHPGEQVGIRTMHERARRLGAKLRIDSEPGEGTQVLLTFGGADDPAEDVVCPADR